ncbi:nucleotidyltransferase family protein [Peptoniphilus equinus]|uniref:Nucleotidyltransferase family protein n=1 Tax=Peptoniphilus equinus TaxID=3016343 RepID=A0ABY7QUW3_9FIRM|nr:nucleotidyltransferase family protein [Peptoniphilus equinus]WBW50584.1 nucleotidyltransferase family protein [Peptoniphilus equinus]
MALTSIIMASGLSQRMGENKLFLDFKNKQLYQITLDLMEGLRLDEVIVVSVYREILDEAKARGFLAVLNENPTEGKAASIRLGVEAAKPENGLIFFVADQPLLTHNTVEALIDAYEQTTLITYPVVNQRRGAPVIFPPEYREKLQALTGDQGGMVLTVDEDVQGVDIADESELLDIDTLDTYRYLKDTYDK